MQKYHSMYFLDNVHKIKIKMKTITAQFFCLLDLSGNGNCKLKNAGLLMSKRVGLSTSWNMLLFSTACKSLDENNRETSLQP